MNKANKAVWKELNKEYNQVIDDSVISEYDTIQEYLQTISPRTRKRFGYLAMILHNLLIEGEKQ